MWWPLRNQILVPLLAIVSVAIAAIAIVAATLAAQRGEALALEQLRRVIDTLGRPSFPFTPAVLERMRGLSGAHFVVYDDGGTVSAATIAEAGRVPRAWLERSGQNNLGPLDAQPTLELDGARYLAARLRPTAGRNESLLVLVPESRWRQSRWDAAWPPLAVGAGAIVLVVVASSWVAHRIGRRLRTVQHGVAAIAAGEFTTLDPGPHRDEVNELVLSVNRMSQDLQRMRDEIRRNERAGLLAQLAAGLAHQLRNAVTGARLAVQVHRRRCNGLGDDASLEVALRQLSLTEEQLKGILALGRSEPKPPEPVDLRTLLDDVSLLIGPACEHAKVSLSVMGSAPALRPVIELEGVRAAVLNLALNAIEAAGPGGEVLLRSTAEAGTATIAVVDNGPGPPPDLAERLFEPFVTGKPEGSGVGLGLALAQRVANDHGGTLRWERADGRTVFQLTLPNVPVEHASPPIAEPCAQ